MARKNTSARIKVAEAQMRYLRVAPRKVRLIADAIRGKSVAEARNVLAFTLKPGVVPHIDRLLKSAVANAKHGDPAINTDELLVGDIQVDSGPIMKRWHPRAYGRAGRILKRTSHVRLTLTES